MPQILNAHGTGWSDARMPPNSVYVGRQVIDRRQGVIRFRESKWANRYRIGRAGTCEELIALVIALYRTELLRTFELMAALPELRGNDLVCWCAPEACHADVLLELANRD
jgi:hypothetical protein